MDIENKPCDLSVDLSGGLQERLARVSEQLELTLAELVRLAVVNQLPELEAEAGTLTNDNPPPPSNRILSD